MPLGRINKPAIIFLHVMRRIREPRFLRSDGKPNFENRIYEAEPELEKIMNSRPVTIPRRDTVGDLLKLMSESGYRRIPVVSGDNMLAGIVTATDVVNYFGGGSLNLIVRERHKMNIFKAYNERVERIMSEPAIHAELSEKIRDIVEKMYRYNVGGLPVTYQGRVVGFVSEKDVVAYFRDELEGRVSEHMSEDVAGIGYADTLLEAMRRIVETGYRRLVVFSGDKAIGVISAMDIVRYLASEKPFQRAVNGRLEEAVSVSVSDVASPEIISIEDTASLAEAFDAMSRNGVGMLLVRNREGKIRGVITERDLLNALALARG